MRLRPARQISELAVGHLAVDGCMGAVVALLPFLVAERGLGYAEASALVLASTFASSIVQPLFGVLSDRRSSPAVLPLSLLVAGGGIAVVGLLDSFPAMLAAVTVSGLGVAAYHPEATRYASYVSRRRPATGMSFFAVGGNIGFVVGPLTVGLLVTPLGLVGTVGLLAVPAAAAIALARSSRRLRRIGARSRERQPVVGENRWRPFVGLAIAVVLRSMAYFALITFAPLYLVRELDLSPAAANWALTATLAAGVVGTLVGGRAADRVGTRAVFVASMAAVPPLVVGFLVAPLAVAIVLLTLAGGAVIATFSTTVVLGQELLPGRLGVASGVTQGMSIGIGGAGASLLGVVAEQIGLHGALEVAAALPLLALALALIALPSAGRARQPA